MTSYATQTLLIWGAVIWLAAGILVVALCRAAAEGDRRREENVERLRRLHRDWLNDDGRWS